jgi:FkbM family methyltransferase
MLHHRDIRLLPSRLYYYFRTLCRMVRGMAAPVLFPRLRGGTGAGPSIRLKSGEQFQVRSLMDAWSVAETWLNRVYNGGTVSAKQPTRIIDIGGGIGDFSVLASRLFPEAAVVVFEPHPETCQFLRDNIEINGCSRVEVRQEGVSGVKRPLLIVSHSTGSPLSCSTVSGGDRQQHGMPVAATTFGELLAQFQNDTIFLKLDAEGIEYELFNSVTPEQLRSVASIAMEYHEFSPDMQVASLKALLERAGYQVRVQPSPVHAYLGYLHAVRVDR